MDVEKIRTELREFLSDFKLGQAIKTLQNRLNINSPKSHEFIFLRYTSNKLREEKLNGTKSEESLQVQENKLVNNFLQFIDSLDETDLILSEEINSPKKRMDSFLAIGMFRELRIPQFEYDFKSRHLLSDFNYSSIDTFSGEMYKLILSREGDKIVFAGEQNVKFRKNNKNEEGPTVKEYIYGQGDIVGEYAYIDYNSREYDGVITRKGKLIFNIANRDNIYGYFMTPDIELPGIITLGRMEIKIKEKI